MLGTTAGRVEVNAYGLEAADDWLSVSLVREESPGKWKARHVATVAPEAFSARPRQ